MRAVVRYFIVIECLRRTMCHFETTSTQRRIVPHIFIYGNPRAAIGLLLDARTRSEIYRESQRFRNFLQALVVTFTKIVVLIRRTRG